MEKKEEGVQWSFLILQIEPAISAIFDMPVGTDLTLEYENGRKFFVDSETGERIPE